MTPDCLKKSNLKKGIKISCMGNNMASSKLVASKSMNMRSITMV